MLYPEIRLAREKHLHRMAEIERQCFPCPWSESQINMFIRPFAGTRSWIAECCGEVVGYVCAGLNDSGMLHVANLVVVPRLRKAGIAAKLMNVAESWGSRTGANAAFLEVRRENSAAIELYKNRGYWLQTVLKDFYGQGIDGLKLLKELSKSPAETELARTLATRIDAPPPVGVVLGSGLSWVVELFGEAFGLEYTSLPGFQPHGIPGHLGRLTISSCGRFVFLMGRRHRYQGFDADSISLLPGVMSDLGTTCWILTSSSGAVNPSYEVGDAMIFEDHVNLSGSVPTGLQGRTGSAVYSRELRELAEEAAAGTGAGVHSGTFACVSGPTYETPAELEFLRGKGVSAVSMSTVPESLLLSGRGCDVLALSLITNTAGTEGFTHDDVLSAQSTVQEKQSEFIGSLLEMVAEYAVS